MNLLMWLVFRHWFDARTDPRAHHPSCGASGPCDCGAAEGKVPHANPWHVAGDAAACPCGRDDMSGCDCVCYHVNGGERTVDGWTCDDCGQFFPLGTVVEGERA